MKNYKVSSVAISAHNQTIKKQFGRQIFASILALGLTFSLGACKDNSTTSNLKTSSPTEIAPIKQQIIKIAYLPITHALPVLALAQNNEISKKHNIKIELVRYSSWLELLDALNTGHVDAAPVLAELAMKAHEQGLDLIAGASGHLDGNVFIASNKITTASDLKGKTIAIPHRQSSHYLLLLEVLKRGGLTKNDIQITELAPAEMPAALASGQIDAYCVAEPFGALGEILGLGHVLYTSAELWPHSLCCLLVLNKKFIKNNPELAKAFLDIYQAIGPTLENKAEAVKVASHFLKQNTQVLEKSLAFISFADLKLNENIYQELATKVKDAGLSSNPPSYKDFVYHD